jgi:hypothetical protein
MTAAERSRRYREKKKAAAVPAPIELEADVAPDMTRPPNLNQNQRQGLIYRETAKAVAKPGQGRLEFEESFRKYDGCGQYAFQAAKMARPWPLPSPNYAKLETALRSNFVGGIGDICAMFQVHPLLLAQKLAEVFGQPPWRARRGG